MATGVILLAAGSSRRFGGRVPKQLLPFKGRPLFIHSLKVFSRVKSVKEIVLVVAPPHVKKISNRIRAASIKKKIMLVPGGRWRGESVKRGLRALGREVDVVLVHDAARALVTPSIISRVEKAARKFGVALAAWPLGDTLKVSTPKSWVKKTIPRNNLWCAQTPQGFRRDIADKCLNLPTHMATDDVQLAEKRGIKVKLVMGSHSNIKVTYPHDLKICQVLAKK